MMKTNNPAPPKQTMGKTDPFNECAAIERGKRIFPTDNLKHFLTPYLIGERSGFRHGRDYEAARAKALVEALKAALELLQVDGDYIAYDSIAYHRINEALTLWESGKGGGA